MVEHYLELGIEAEERDAEKVWQELICYMRGRWRAGSEFYITQEELDRLTVDGKLNWLPYERLLSLQEMAGGVETSSPFYQLLRRESKFAGGVRMAGEAQETDKDATDCDSDSRDQGETGPNITHANRTLSGPTPHIRIGNGEYVLGG